MVKLTEIFNDAKTEVQDLLSEIRKKARKEDRKDILDATEKIETGLGSPFKFENALMEFEKIIKK